MTDRECFKLAGEITLALYAGTVIGNLINLWRGRRRKLFPWHRIPPDRIDTWDIKNWRPVPTNKLEWDNPPCTCKWNKVPTPDASSSAYAYQRETDANCRFHGSRP